MAEAKTPAAPVAAPTSHNSTAREVLAQRQKNAQDAGTLTPKLQRQLDKMAANIIMKGKK